MNRNARLLVSKGLISIFKKYLKMILLTFAYGSLTSTPSNIRYHLKCRNMFPLYYLHSDVCSKLKPTRCCISCRDQIISNIIIFVNNRREFVYLKFALGTMNITFLYNFGKNFWMFYRIHTSGCFTGSTLHLPFFFAGPQWGASIQMCVLFKGFHSVKYITYSYTTTLRGKTVQGIYYYSPISNAVQSSVDYMLIVQYPMQFSGLYAYSPISRAVQWTICL